MKKVLIISALFCAFACLSCKKGSSKPSSATVDRTLFPGLWISDVSKNGQNEYKSRNFRTDSVMIVDESNFGLGPDTGTWYWLKGDTIYATSIGASRGLVLSLSADSLTINWIDAQR